MNKQTLRETSGTHDTWEIELLNAHAPKISAPRIHTKIFVICRHAYNRRTHIQRPDSHTHTQLFIEKCQWQCVNWIFLYFLIERWLVESVCECQKNRKLEFRWSKTSIQEKRKNDEIDWLFRVSADETPPPFADKLNSLDRIESNTIH